VTIQPGRLLPANVAAGVRNRWPDLGPAWCEQVEAQFLDWLPTGAVPIAVFPARYGLVVDVNVAGDRVVYRASPDPNGVNQTAVTAAFARLGVGPQLHESGQTAIGAWTVTERIFPGTPLGDMNPTDINPEAVLKTLLALKDQPAPLPNMPTIVDWLRERLEDDDLRDLAPGTAPAPLHERQRALALLRELSADAPNSLCHGDASPWNMLHGSDSRIWFIDPRGVSGCIEYDAAVLAMKAGELSILPATPYLPEAVDHDPEKIAAWLIVATAARI